MPIKPITLKTTELINNIRISQNKIMYSFLLGDTKTYQIEHKAYSTLVTQNFDIAKNIENPKITVPLFSRMGLNILKVKFLDIFRKHTPEEKLMAKLLREEKLRRQIDKIL